MKKILTIIIIFIIFIILLNSPSFAQNKVLINEFLIGPSPQTVELINIGTESADISNWYIDDNGGLTYYTIADNTYILPNGCLVFSYDFNLNKSSSDVVRLFDNTAPPTQSTTKLIDSFYYKTSPGPGVSFLRIPDGENNWTTASASLGLFNLTSQSCLVTPTFTITPSPWPTPTNTIILSPTLTPEPTIESLNNSSFYNNIFLSEAMVYPDTGNNEWIEIYNDNDFSADLVNWYLDDIENAGSSPKMFSLEIPAKSYGTIELSSSMFNNDGDNIRLLDHDKNLKDSFEYNNADRNKTFGRTSFNSDYFCLQEPSKETTNNSCLIRQAINNTSTSSKNSTSSYLETKQSNSSKTNLLDKKSLIKTGQPITLSRLVKQKNILGASVQREVNKPFPHQPLVRHLSLTSLSYSALTVISLLIKMKNGL